MTFSESVNVSASYRQQEHTRKGTFICVIGDDGAVPMCPDDSGSRPGRQRVKRAESVPGSAAAVAERGGSEVVLCRGDPNQGIQIPFLW